MPRPVHIAGIGTVLMSDQGKAFRFDQVPIDIPDGSVVALDVTGLPEDLFAPGTEIHNYILDPRALPGFFEDDANWEPSALAQGVRAASLFELPRAILRGLYKGLRAARPIVADRTMREARKAMGAGKIVSGHKYAVGALLAGTGIFAGGLGVSAVVTAFGAPRCNPGSTPLEPGVQLIVAVNCDQCIVKNGVCTERFTSSKGPINDLTNLLIVGGISVVAIALVLAWSGSRKGSSN